MASWGTPFSLRAESARRSFENDRIVLENELLRAAILPAQGGSIESLSLKPGEVSLLAEPSFQISHLRDRGSRGSLAKLAFEVEGGPADAEGDEVEVRLTAFCKLKPEEYTPGGFGKKRHLPRLYFETPDASSVRVDRVYRLGRRRAALEMECTFTNTGGDPLPWTFVLTARPSVPGERARCLLPGRQGVESLKMPGGPVDAFFYDGPDAWWSVLSPDGRGLSAQFDVAQVSCLRVAGDGRTAPVVEVVSTTEDLPSGKSVTFKGWLAALRDCPGVSFAGRGVCGVWQMNPPDSASKPRGGSEEDMLLFVPTYGAEKSEEISGKLSLLGARDQDVEVAFSRRLNRTDRRVEMDRKKVALKAGVPMPMPLSLRVDEAGTWLLRAEVLAGGEKAAWGEMPLDVGHRSGFFLPRPEGPRLGRVYEDFRYADLQGLPPPHEAQADWQPEPEVVSPHVPYGRPYARGPVRALFVCPFETARGVLELAERVHLDADCAIVGLHGYSTMHKYYSVGIDHAGVDEVDRIKELLQKPHDVIVLGHYLWGWYPPDVQEEIIRQFKEGTGVVISSPVKLFGFFGDLAEKAQPAAELFPEADPDQLFFPGDFGKVAVYRNEFEEEGGRFVLSPITYTHLKPETWIGFVENDVERLGRSLLWAARKEPEISLEAADCPAAGFVDDLRGQAVRVRSEHRGKLDFDGVLRLDIRRDLAARYPLTYGSLEFIARPYASWEPAGEVIQPLQIPAGHSAEATLALPALGDGLYSLDFSLVDAQGRVATWYRRTLTVRSPVEIAEVWTAKEGWPPFRADGGSQLSEGKIVPDPLPQLPLYAAETLSVRVVLRAREGWAGNDLTVTLDVLDRTGRTFGRVQSPASLQAGAGEVSFSIPLARAVHLMNVLRVQAGQRDRALSETRLPLPIHRRPDRTTEYKLRMYDHSLRQPEKTAVDIRSGIMWPGGCFIHAWVDQGMEEWGNYLERAAEITPEFIRIPCLTNPDYRERSKEAILRSFRSTLAFVPPRAVLADEWTYCLSIEGGDAAASLSQCRCRFCLERFQRYLRVEYRSLEALNAAWGTAFRRWEEATPPLFDSRGLASLSEERTAHVLDHRCFIDTQVGEYVGLMNQAVKSLDPQCEVGISGNEPITPWNNLDIWQLATNGKHNTIYRYQGLWESFGVVGVSQWTGYGNMYSPPREHEKTWAFFLSGRSISYYGKDNTPIFQPDYRIFSGPSETFRAVKEIKDGLAQLLWTFKARDPVALVYHSRSIYADMMERYIYTGRTGKPSHREAGGHALNAGSSLEALLNQALIQPYWISYEQLQKRNWEGFPRTRLLFLPYTTCLRPDEAETIRSLVQEGATVVGDVNTGMRDGHGGRQKAGSLDDLFGIRHEGDWDYPVLRAEKNREDPRTRVRFELPDIEPFQISFFAVSPPHVTPTTAKPHASYEIEGRRLPALLLNAYGKGKAILLNFIPSDYFVVTASEQGAEISIEEKAKRDVGARFETIMSWILEQAGVRPPLSVSIGGKPASPKNFRRFQRGRHSYLGFCGQGGLTPAEYAANEETAALDRDYHLYEVRRGRYLGFGRQLQVKYEVLDVARLFSCLPYRVDQLAVQPGQPEWPAGSLAAFSVRVEASETLHPEDFHALRVEVTDSRGRSRDSYRTVVPAAAGKAVAEIPLADNDPPGSWKIRITDVATGVASEAAFDVKPARE